MTASFQLFLNDAFTLLLQTVPIFANIAESKRKQKKRKYKYSLMRAGKYLQTLLQRCYD